VFDVEMESSHHGAYNISLKCFNLLSRTCG
jgi:hypothetical protein